MRKILVIRLSSLGDVVLAIPVFKRLRAVYPQAHIAVLVKDAYADVLREESSINEVITVSTGESLSALCKKIRAMRFDGVLDLHANIRSRCVSAASGAKRVVRYDKAALARRLFVSWRLDRQRLQEHTLERYLEALNRFLNDSGVRMSHSPERILIIQTAFLGDAVLTMPLLDALKSKFPSSRRTLLCTPEVKDVFTNAQVVDEVILFDKRGNEQSLKARWALVQQMRTRHFDLAIIPHRSVTSALMAFLAGIPRRVGFSSSQASFLMTDVVPFQWGQHDVQRNLSLLNIFGVQDPSRELWLKPEPEVVQAVAQKLRQAGVRPGDRLVGVNAGSVWPTKRWLAEGFAEVADRLLATDHTQVLFIGGPKDRAVMDQVLYHMKRKPINWVGETSLKELIAAVSQCSAFLTNDSGPMHIAVATRVPTVAIFGPTTKELGFFPYGEGHVVLERDLGCRPCSLHGTQTCPLGHFNCMKHITPDEVLGAVERQLAKRK